MYDADVDDDDDDVDDGNDKVVAAAVVVSLSLGVGFAMRNCGHKCRISVMGSKITTREIGVVDLERIASRERERERERESVIIKDKDEQVKRRQKLTFGSVKERSTIRDCKGRGGGGQVVSLLAFYSDDLSSNPAEANSFL